jgi:hypothetical protein
MELGSQLLATRNLACVDWRAVGREALFGATTNLLPGGVVVGGLRRVGATVGIRQIGRAGEAAAGITRNTRRIPSFSGSAKYRIPDGLNAVTGVLEEVKNVKRLSLSNQLRDSLAYAQHQGYRFELIVRTNTILSSELDAVVQRGDIILRRILS